MNWDSNQYLDNIQDGIINNADKFQKQLSELHKTYVTKIIPDFGKYGDVAKYAAEMLPGVSEYNAIKDGDWTAFAIAAGLDLTSFVVPGGAAVKGASISAKAGLKFATKEIAEASAKKLSNEVIEIGAKKVSTEIVEKASKKIVCDALEEGVEKSVKVMAETGAKQITKEVGEIGIKKASVEIVENSVEKIAHETIEEGFEQSTKNIVEIGTDALTKEALSLEGKNITTEIIENSGEKVVHNTLNGNVEKSTEKIITEGLKRTIGKETIESVTKEITESTVKESTKDLGNEIIKKSIEKIDMTNFKEYLDDVVECTHREIKQCQRELLDKAVKEKEYFKIDAKKLHSDRKKFERNKMNLIKQWEIETGQKWPGYTENVLNEAGEVIRTINQPYDAHHIIELSVGGADEWWNLHPARFPDEHQKGIHRADGMARKIFGH